MALSGPQNRTGRNVSCAPYFYVKLSGLNSCHSLARPCVLVADPGVFPGLFPGHPCDRSHPSPYHDNVLLPIALRPGGVLLSSLANVFLTHECGLPIRLPVREGPSLPTYACMVPTPCQYLRFKLVAVPLTHSHCIPSPVHNKPLGKNHTVLGKVRLRSHYLNVMFIKPFNNWVAVYPGSAQHRYLTPL